MFRRSFLVLSLSAICATFATPTLAQTWPTKPIKLIVGFPPGGPVDNIVRLIAPGLGKELGQTVIIENKPGAAGGLGTTATVQADPDGYTFGVGVLGILAVAPHVSKMPYKPEDVNYVTMLTRSPHVFVSNPNVPGGFKDLKAFVEAARKAPGKLNYGSPGQGSSTHLDGEMLQDEAGIDILHVPYKGGAAAVNALLADEIQLLAAEISAALPLQSKLRIVAVMGEKRAPQLPDVPTTAELGYPGVVANSMYGVIAPAKTPAAITEKFRNAVRVVLNQPEIRDRLLSQGQTPVPGTGDEYRALMTSESQKWARVIKTRSIKFD
jgi:tripartite-type tricarboxylate transporter receptor subunit TctC